MRKKKLVTFEEEEEEELQYTGTGTPIRYLPLDHVYSASAPCSISASGSSNVMSKKVKARKLTDDSYLDLNYTDPDVSSRKKQSLSSSSSSYPPPPPPILHVYIRRRKKTKTETHRDDAVNKDSVVVVVESDSLIEELEKISADSRVKKRKNPIGNNELASLGINPSFADNVDCSDMIGRGGRLLRSNRQDSLDSTLINNSNQKKKWLPLSSENVDGNKFVGLTCKVYWPLDDEWYTGSVTSYSLDTGKHHVSYDDGQEEDVIFVKEEIKFYICSEEMQQLNLKMKIMTKEAAGINNEELLVLASIFDDCTDFEVGDIVWAKLKGHAMWPAVVVHESDVGERKGFKANHDDGSIPVQFFGTHDFAWISLKQVVSFLRGLHSSYHLKCKQPRFHRGLQEAKVYLGEQILPNKMLQRQNGIEVDDSESSEEDDGSNSSDDDLIGDRRTLKASKCTITCPFEIDDLRVISLGKIVTDSEFFHDDRDCWPEGYTAERKFISAIDPTVQSCYTMEVLRDPDSKFRPLFRVTMDGVEQFKGSTPTACWNKIYRRIRRIGGLGSDGCTTGDGLEKLHSSGSHMFGFSIPEVSKIIKELSNSRKSSIYPGCKSSNKRYPDGYRPVSVDWKDLDKCNVCHMDEEYANNVFLQCDKCRMMVHARCYGEPEPVDGVLWLCNLCRPGAPNCPPPCCLCPVIGGAMKPTTEGKWAHLACAIWIPETCLSDIKKMEPIDGVSRVSKDRWKLLCSICGVSYGACIQCSNSTCRVAYHPLCARAAGLCVELEDEDKLHLISFDEDEEDQCIRLHSFCKKHRQPSNERSTSDEQMQTDVCDCSEYIPLPNPSGSARTEPYDVLRRRGQKKPEAVAAASLKRLYVENRPYLVTGYCQNGTLQNSSFSNEMIISRFSANFGKSSLSQLDTSKSVLSMAQKYKCMKETVRVRLAFGKSRIHKFGVFAKQLHKAGDMVIEYTGELVRPSIADRREHFIYNSLVGAGTYMFRIDDERVIDATRAGSIAHLINHSCEPNCYSRVVTISGDEHIIIFAKRDITRLEELTYDYRFFSIGEQLACYCGFPRCRGVVNDIDSEDQVAKLWVPRSELIGWKEDQE